MARFPVTNAEWRLFMLAGGYEDDRWWDTEAAKAWRAGKGTSEGPKSELRDYRRTVQGDRGLPRKFHQQGRWTSQQVEDWESYARMSDDEFEALLAREFPGGRQTQPGWWNSATFNHLSQPVVGICWFEARAYCAWLSAQSEQEVRLPSEIEWEAAARGRSASTYAWGQTFDARRCNTFETHVRGTTPVGVFSAGDTPTNLSDVTGNVWEWTSSAYLDYPYVGSDGREDASRADLRRVVRGGSWDDSRDNARASYRNNNHPDNRNNNIGCRVVVSHIGRGSSRQCSSTTVDGPRKGARMAQAGPVRTSRRGARRAHSANGRPPGQRPPGRPPLALDLLQPATEQTPDLRDHRTHVFVLSGGKPTPLMGQPQIQAYAREPSVRGPQRHRARGTSLALRVHERLLKVERRIHEALCDREPVRSRERLGLG